jgi:hypothetical protein
MKEITATARNWLGIMTMLLCLLSSGCESMIDGVFNSLTHDHEVATYEHHGMSQKEAERNVFEDHFFEDMDNHAQ